MVKKDAFIILRVTTSLKSTLEKKAKKAGKNISRFVREILETV